ncbi:MAG: ribbon-helix-helix protein, CopG family [Desulfurococcaceae archaeon]
MRKVVYKEGDFEVVLRKHVKGETYEYCLEYGGICLDTWEGESSTVENEARERIRKWLEVISSVKGKTTVTTYMDEKDVKKLKDMAQKKGVSVAHLVRDIIKKWLEVEEVKDKLE